MAVRISAGHVYDPDKARVIGAATRGELFNPEGENVPSTGMWERLQRSKSGKYFVFGRGGSETRYAVMDGGTWKAGSQITPLSAEEASAWAKRHLSEAEWESEFGEPDPEAVRTLSVKIPETVYQMIRNEAAELGVSMGEVVASRFTRRTQEKE